MNLRGLSPNFHIHVSASDLYIPTIGQPVFLQQNRQIDWWEYINSFTRKGIHICDFSCSTIQCTMYMCDREGTVYSVLHDSLF
jgi:hypothetical protein